MNKKYMTEYTATHKVPVMSISEMNEEVERMMNQEAPLTDEERDYMDMLDDEVQRAYSEDNMTIDSCNSSRYNKNDDEDYDEDNDEDFC